jgi:hypothetical protein
LKNPKIYYRYVNLLKMDIKLLINKKAKKTIKNITVDNEYKLFINRWLSETRTVKCYILYENNKIKTFALLSKMDYDPINTHSNPYILDFIYTFKQYRRNMLAYKLLIHIKNIEEITAFCSNDNSIMLFQKAEYKLTEYEQSYIPVFRYP